MYVLRALNVSCWFVLRWSYNSDYESKSFRWRKVQLCGHECSRRGSQTHLPHSIQWVHVHAVYTECVTLGWEVNIFLCPLLFSSSQYQGQRWGCSRGGEHPSREIIDSGVWNQCGTSSQHHLVQEREGGVRFSQPAHPRRGTEAWNQNHGGKAQKLLWTWCFVQRNV